MDYIEREASLDAEDEEEFDPETGHPRSNPTNGSGQRDFEDSSDEEDDDDDEEAARVCFSIPILSPAPPC